MGVKNLQEELEVLKDFKIESGSGMAYVEQGKGEQVLLFIHGLGSNRYAWLGNFSYLSDHYRCIAIDLPNYGGSDKGKFSFTMKFFKDQVIRFCEALALKKVTLVGHSMGAQIAVHLAVEKPGLFNKLILLAPAGIETFNEFEKQWFKQINKPEMLFAATEDQIKSNFETNFVFFGPEAKWMLNERLEFMKHKETYFNYCKMICTCVFEMLDAPVKPLLHKILQSTLVLYGAEDQLVPNRLLHPTMSVDSLLAETKKLIPLTTVKKIAKAGHFVQTDQMDLVNEEILKFMKTED